MTLPANLREFTDIYSLCRLIGIRTDLLRKAEAEADFNYTEEEIQDPRSQKPRQLCYPPKDSVLRLVQQATKDRILVHFDLAPAVRGYVRGSDNIKVASEISGRKYIAALDISQFHPSITKSHVAVALNKHGLSWPWSRQIARLVTFDNRVPQGACTSSHIANLVLDSIIRRSILPFAAERNVTVVNYGDDIAFAGLNCAAVNACIARAQREIVAAGFRTNDRKTVAAQHIGGKRLFIGCATGRRRPDLPRTRFRALRKELRALLQESRSGIRPDDKRLTSVKCKIDYVARLNPRKARALRDVFYRICDSVRRRRRSSR